MYMTESTDQRKRILHVSKFIMENFDEIHNRFTATDVLDYLGELNIRADRRAIYGDIAALSEVWDDYEIESVPRGAFYVRSRPFTFADLCLISQCVYAAKFISDEQAETLIDIIGDFGSKAEKEELLKEVKTISRVERAQTGQKNTLAMVGIIREAIRIKHRIRFKYIKRVLNSETKQIERNHGEPFTVSPYNLIMSDGYFYMYGYSDLAKAMRFYRIDRMRDVELTDTYQYGLEEYQKVDKESMARRMFFMSAGETKNLRIQFKNKLLDAVVDRFGLGSNVIYRPSGKQHFILSADIEVSPQFFGWLCSFGTDAQIIYSPEVAKEYADYLENIGAFYAADINEKETWAAK